MPLTDSKVRALKPRLRPYKQSDGHQLYAYISTAGGISWRYDYQFNGKRRTLALGRYPAVSLHDARDAREDAEALLAKGIDPADDKQKRKRVTTPAEAPTFEQSARAWHAKRMPKWTEAYARQVMARLEADVFPFIGAKTFAQINPRDDLHDVLERVEKRGVGETVRRLRQYIGAIYRNAGARDASIVDPSPFLRVDRKELPEVAHHAMLPLKELGGFVLRIDTYRGEPETTLAIKLTMLTVVRTMESLGARWDEFEHWERERDLPKALWRIPGERMKMKDDHIVPLSRQACAVLRDLHAITGEGFHVFPVGRSTPGRRATMSNNAMLFATYRMGYRGRQTIHGLRRSFSTWGNESGWPSDDIELCLAHDERDKVRSAYNAAKRLEPRRQLLQAWADWLDKERQSARILG